MGTERRIFKCTECGLNQFVISSKKCRRCHLPLVLPEFKLPDIEIGEEVYVPPKLSTAKQQFAEIPERMRFFQKQLGMKQIGFKEKCRISRSYTSRICTGAMSPSVGVLEKVFEGLGLSAQEFFSNELEFILSPFDRELLYWRRKLSAEQFSKVISVITRLAEQKNLPSSWQ